MWRGGDFEGRNEIRGTPDFRKLEPAKAGLEEEVGIGIGYEDGQKGPPDFIGDMFSLERVWQIGPAVFVDTRQGDAALYASSWGIGGGALFGLKSFAGAWYW